MGTVVLCIAVQNVLQIEIDMTEIDNVIEEEPLVKDQEERSQRTTTTKNQKKL